LALGYADENPDGVITFALRPEAKILLWEDYPKFKKLISEDSRLGNDPGRVAALFGFDAIEIPAGSTAPRQGFPFSTSSLVLLNRSAAVVVDPRKKPANKKTAKTRLAGANAVLDYITENADALSEETPGTPGDWMLNNIYRQQGFDQILPSVVETPDDLPEGTRLFRGVGDSISGFSETESADAYDEAVGYAEQFRSGTHYPGTGILGAGTYFATRREEAERYMHPNDKGEGKTPKTLISVSVSPDARLADWDDVRGTVLTLKAELETRRLQAKDDKERAKIDFLARLINDPGRVAALMGYDGMQERVVFRDGRAPAPGYTVVFNRGVLTVSKVGAPKAPVSPPADGDPF
jgi:hypothetical protein